VLTATADPQKRESVKVRQRMEGGRSSSRDTASEVYKEDYKVELYESAEVLLYDKELRKLLCSIEGGVYRDALIPALKRLLRPITKDDVVDIISNMIQLGLFTVEMRVIYPVTLPRQLLVKKVKTKKGVVEILKPPEGFEVVDTIGDVVVFRVSKVFLKPTQELRAVCNVLSRG
jgi:hypothetical protein